MEFIKKMSFDKCLSYIFSLLDISREFFFPQEKLDKRYGYFFLFLTLTLTL